MSIIKQLILYLMSNVKQITLSQYPTSNKSILVNVQLQTNPSQTMSKDQTNPSQSMSNYKQIHLSQCPKIKQIHLSQCPMTNKSILVKVHAHLNPFLSVSTLIHSTASCFFTFNRCLVKKLYMNLQSCVISKSSEIHSGQTKDDVRITNGTTYGHLSSSISSC